ncbi:MAG: cysteine desulfurase family protein [Planctomycetota bacterium]|nr:cysteine desulfurase family protein [Planctomycetota bacterium]MDA1179627.1 cysteine desulfurase family protein [Planctomycetota bacterium]
MTKVPTESYYLDHNATTRVHPEVVESMREYELRGYANPASQHYFGRKARQVLEDCRDRILELMGAEVGAARGDRLIFTSGATEANNLAIRGLVVGSHRPLMISTIEHPSVSECADWLERRGRTVFRWPVTVAGRADVSGLPLCDEPPQLISLMLANHETGVLQPVSDLTRHVREAGWPTLVHTDAVQAVGKHPVVFRDLQVDALSISGHKFHGPAGIGGLLLRSGISPPPVLLGGSQQMGTRPGTESVALAVGMRTALEICQRDLQQRISHMQLLRNELQIRLLAAFPWVVVNGAEPRLPNTLNVSCVGLDRQSLLLALDRHGIACATGSACESGSSRPSPVLVAMGCPEQHVQSAIRFSIGADVTAQDMEQVAERIVAAIARMAGSRDGGMSPVV